MYCDIQATLRHYRPNETKLATAKLTIHIIANSWTRVLVKKAIVAQKDSEITCLLVNQKFITLFTTAHY